jgi:lysophospholipase L1-like esterase
MQTDAYNGVEDLESLWLVRWDRHPNAEGQELLAERLYPELVEMLSSE